MEYEYRTDNDPFRQVLLLSLINSYKIKAVTQDLANDQLGELVISEIYTSLKTHFGNRTSREIIKAIFTSIVKHEMMIEQKKVKYKGFPYSPSDRSTSTFRNNKGEFTSPIKQINNTLLN